MAQNLYAKRISWNSAYEGRIPPLLFAKSPRASVSRSPAGFQPNLTTCTMDTEYLALARITLPGALNAQKVQARRIS